MNEKRSVETLHFKIKRESKRQRFSALMLVGAMVLLLLIVLLIYNTLQGVLVGEPKQVQMPDYGQGAAIGEVTAANAQSSASNVQPEFSNTAAEQAPASAPEPTSQPATAVIPKAPLEPIHPNDWNLIIVDAGNPISKTFTVDLAGVSGGQLVDTRIAYQVEQMLQDAEEAGIHLVVASGYRSVADQEKLLRSQMFRYVLTGHSIAQARELAAGFVIEPGHSEHHTGLAVDITTTEYKGLNVGFADTTAFQWLADHAFRYGFILRYPKTKQDITGVSYRPWHYRYVGAEHAVAMVSHELCLEEYLLQAPRSS